MAVVMMAMAPDYGRRIRLRRQALGMSQEELGESVGASASAVISWEKHRHAPTRKQGAIEAVLGISLDEDQAAAADSGEIRVRELMAELGVDEAGVKRVLKTYRENSPGRVKRAS